MNNAPGRILLAPMEGLADVVLRDVLTRIGGYDQAVSEFVRVSASLLPARTFWRRCPEIAQGGRTAAGTPVAVQLLGSDPAWLAGNAARLAALAPPGIDLNFGCPAKTVNRHGGGAMLLAEPERLFAIAEAVRRAVDASIPVTAKMRLGITDTARALDCAMALAEGGVAGLVVHARTKAEGYRPPAHWEWVANIGAAVDVPVVANGEIWTVADWRCCCALAGTRDVMLGRGAVSDPWLALRIRGARSPLPLAADWQALLPHLAAYWQGVRRRVLPEHAPGRLKLWLGMLRRTWPQEAGALLTALRAETDAEVVEKRLYAALRTGTT